MDGCFSHFVPQLIALTAASAAWRLIEINILIKSTVQKQFGME